MVIELLKFRVAPEERENYIQKDAEIWTTWLAKYPGFLGKEVWINPNDSTELILIIRWATREQWKAIPLADLQIIEDEFTKAMKKSYPIVESAEFQVRKFPHS
ncbi:MULTISPECIES: TIGR03792 family protein [unclassified Nodularia (in: cyanobacteria)]|uniref:TIGR03792 family protein n=1 Tax=unclassified Nodularia (in: cyanobacteria) TaxID=2656917 RepID=UPI0018814B5A|nr:TIGR03792 family protein [Nodularia sp. LEGE 06071]MBE9200166.1 TIGR03792 family protein [Nodularia sp. LEGE 06071]MCC2694726.1 TIGR03792 family protein [Nodularia sp. LEGE 04288]